MQKFLHTRRCKKLVSTSSLITYSASQIALIFFIATLAACQKKPALAPSIDALSNIEPPPMGASTYNDELKSELNLLDDLLNDRIPAPQIAMVKRALTSGNMNTISRERDSRDMQLAQLFLMLPELGNISDSITPNRQQWYRAKLFFMRRRFIEASLLMSRVLQQEPHFLDAINWRARAIFFLGNPDLATRELQRIIEIAGESTKEGLDALYLLGAISFESDDTNKDQLETGINAWTRYLELADNENELRTEISEGLKKLHARKENKTQVTTASPNDPFLPRSTYSDDKNAILTAFAKQELLLALELCDHELKKHEDPDIATVKARILFKSGRLDEAAALFETITQKFGDYAPGHHYSGMVFMLKGEPKKAVEAWKRTVAVDQSYAQSHNLEQRIAIAQGMASPEIKVPSH